MDVVRKIRSYMKETGRTQTYLCRKTGLTTTAVSLTLNGKRHLRVSEYCAICKALDVEPGFFLS
ncbi:MAG: helix-turn-helix domain-containing protein [Oscillospiraceae bacterium]|nr:helix-turn-helix domain-containing protein [Oscillospiraceae bacterium]